MIERVFILKRTDLFKELPSGVLASFANQPGRDLRRRRETIFEKGDIGKAMYVVVDGQIRIHDGDREIELLGCDKVFGEVTVLTAEVRTASATAWKRAGSPPRSGCVVRGDGGAARHLTRDHQGVGGAPSVGRPRRVSVKRRPQATLLRRPQAALLVRPGLHVLM